MIKKYEYGNIIIGVKMKNKKGFTLTEILVVIVLLVVISGSTIFGIDEISKKSSEKRLNELIKEIKLATDVYISNSETLEKELLNGNIEEKCTTIDTLQNEGLLDFNLKNPLTNESISNDLCVYTTLSTDGTLIHEFSI